MQKIIIYSEISWAFLDQRHHHLARYLVRAGFNVEFVERVVNRVPSTKELATVFLGLTKSFFLRKNSNRPPKPTPEGLKLRRSKFLPQHFFLFKLWNYVLWFLSERHRQRGAILYSFVDNPVIFGGSLKYLSTHRLAVFDVIHNWWSFPWNTNHHKEAAAQTIMLSDKIITDSFSLKIRFPQYLSSAHVMLPGVSETWLRKNKLDSAKELINPKAAFFGNLRANSDLAFVQTVAQCIRLEIFGLVSNDARKLLKTAYVNGPLNVDELVHKLSEFQIILLPYNRDEFSQTISPAKYFEALATGALIVTRAKLSNLPGFDQFCLTVDNEQGKDLKELLLKSLETHVAQRKSQVEFSRKHLWESRFAELLRFLDI